ncbi:MAG: pectinesterase family protein [Clostridiales bacterium]
MKKKMVKYLIIVATLCTLVLSTILIKAADTEGGTNTDEKSVATVDVWDFGAEELSSEDINYNNLLTADVINGLYDSSVEVGSNANTFPTSFSVGDLSWVTSKTNHRLRTSNTTLTRYDENVKSSEIGDASDLFGCLYLNGSKDVGNFELILEKNDVVNVYVKFDNADDAVIFANESDSYSFDASVNGTQVTFVAPTAGTYKVSDSDLNGKPRYYRITREHSAMSTVSGKISAPEDIPSEALVTFTNDSTGIDYTSKITESSYSVSLPGYSKGMKYTISMTNAKGYVIESESKLSVSSSVVSDISIKKVPLSTISGKITGLTAEQLKLLSIEFKTKEDKVFKPEIIIEGDSYSIDLEQGVVHEVSAVGVNDYSLSIENYTSPTTNKNLDLEFSKKPVYKINLSLDKLTDEEIASATFVFDNLKESGYSYSFTGADSVELRDGTYSVDVFSKSKYAQKLTSNLVVNGAEKEKIINFDMVSSWDFSNSSFTADKCTFGAYNGLLLDGMKKNKSYLLSNVDSSVKVPVAGDSKVTISYAYSAAGSIGDIAFGTSSGSTSTIESTSYNYSGKSGYVDIKFTAKSYVTKIEVKPIVEYKEVIMVGNKKNDYKTINDALYAVSSMDRPNKERVTIKIRPGNYEEMLVIDMENVTLVNAASRPSIALKNKGVNIDKNAVRITSYYGHGCDYYSMTNGTKYSEEELKVNKENGYLSNENPGSGTTNGSYWNSTVVVRGNGFEADGIIFENSFNSYVSKKEANDVVELGDTNKGGERPKTIGDTSVQDKSFVERAAAIAIVDNTDKVVFSNCRVVGKQDSTYGGKNARVLFNKCKLMGATDYIFGGMIAVFYQCDLVMNTSDDKNDKCYITAAQQSTGRGYLMYECNVTSAVPGVDNASTYKSKPGYLGRPWAGKTSEVVYYNTTIDTTDYVGFEGQSIISPEAWLSTLGGPAKCYEYGTIELAEGTDNSDKRVEWSAILDKPELPDGTVIDKNTWLNLTDNKWNPLSSFIPVIDYKIATDWGFGARVNIEITNNSISPITDWTIEWTFSGNQEIKNLWGAKYKQDGSTVTVSNMKWNDLIPSKKSINIGFNMDYSGVNEVPDNFILN